MRFQISLLPQAEEEISAAFQWYFARSPSAAHAFRAEVIAAIDGLAEDALSWPADVDGVRYFVLRRFPYTIHYDIAGTEATVLAVAHQRRRPGYWNER